MRPAQRLLFNLRFLFRVYRLGLLLFFIYRFFYVLRVLPGEWSGLVGDLIKAFVTGIRFDTATINYGLTVPVLLSFLCLVSDRTARIIFSIQKVYLTVLFLLFTFVLIVDYYYY